MFNKQVLAVICTSMGLSVSCFAGDNSQSQGLFYLKVPMGAKLAQEREPSFGFMIRTESNPWAGQANLPRQLPIMDISFRGDGLHALSFFGLQAYRLNAAESESAPANPSAEVNWLLLGGAAVAVAVLANSGKSSDPKVCTASVPPVCN